MVVLDTADGGDAAVDVSTGDTYGPDEALFAAARSLVVLRRPHEKEPRPDGRPDAERSRARRPPQLDAGQIRHRALRRAAAADPGQAQHGPPAVSPAGRPVRPESVPTATYRLQLQPGFGFDEVAEHLGHLAGARRLARVPVPVLQAAPGSTHGYDVVDHSRLNVELGGEAAFDRLADALAARGLSAIADVVPNHMAVPTPGPAQRRAVVGAARRARLAVRALVRRRLVGAGPRRADAGARASGSGRCWRAGELSVATTADSAGDPAGGEPVLRYFDHEFPVRPGTEDLPLARARRPAVVPAGVVAGRRRGAELPALLRRRHAGRGPGRGAGRVRRHPRRCCSS